MKEISNVLIAGAGAIGSMVAAQIHRRSPGSVSILAGGDRLARYRRDGFAVNGERVGFDLTDADSRSSPDLVIVACKAHHLDEVIAGLSRHVGSDTLILSLLNGISSEGAIARAYGEWRVPYAMIVGTDAGRTGTATAYTTGGTIFFGDGLNARSRAEWSPRVRAIAGFFDRAGIAYAVPENMLNRLWYKFMLNVGVNQVTAVTRRPYRIIKTATMIGETRGLVDGAMREVIEVARAEGITLTEEDMESVYRTMDGLSDGGKTSMCQDVEAGRKTEVEIFSGTVIDLGRKHGIPVPVNAALFQILKTIESSYRGAID